MFPEFNGAVVIAFVADVYDAVFDDSALVAVCEGIGSRNPGGALILHYLEHETGKRTVVHAIGLTDTQRAAFEADDTLLDLGGRDAKPPKPVQIHSNLDGVNREAMRCSRQWQKHLGQLDAEWVDFVCLRTSARFSAYLSLAYPRRDEEAASHATRQLLRKVCARLARVMDLRARRFHDIDAQCSALIGRIGSPVVMLDACRCPVRCNDAASGYFAGIPLTKEVGAAPKQFETSRRLEDLLSALGTLAEGPRDVFYLDRDGNHVVASASEYPLTEAPLLRAQWACESLSPPAFLVLMKVAQGRHGTLSQEVAESFKLTPAERRLLEGILTGMTLSEIAEERRVSYNTLKNQLRSVNEKTGIHRQTNLVRVFSSLS